MTTEYDEDCHELSHYLRGLAGLLFCVCVFFPIDPSCDLSAILIEAFFSNGNHSAPSVSPLHNGL